MQRLNKYIASSGICSRRKADELIERGVVNVNGKIVKELGFQVGAKDKVFVNKVLVSPKKFEYYRFYKPAGYITTADDEKGRKTIYDVIPKELSNLKPVGRLDKDSTGLLILTNDGEMINQLTHPSLKVNKVYVVSVEGKVGINDLETFYKGIEIEDGKIAYADAQILEISNKSTMLQVTLNQGMNRQIRKMCDYIGHPVISLKRIQHATISIEGLKRGQVKPIKPSQIKDLKQYLKKIEKDKMIKYALVGNIASGKSTMEKMLEQHNFVVLDTDFMAHDILIDNPQIAKAFSEYDVFEFGRLSREKLGKLVFENIDLKEKLESLIHPLIKKEIETAFETYKNEKYVFISVPLLFEVGWQDMFDKIIFIKTEDDIRLKRLIERNNYKEEYAKKRILSQMSQSEKENKADYVIENNSSLKEFEEKIANFIKENLI